MIYLLDIDKYIHIIIENSIKKIEIYVCVFLYLYIYDALRIRKANSTLDEIFSPLILDCPTLVTNYLLKKFRHTRAKITQIACLFVEFARGQN